MCVWGSSESHALHSNARADDERYHPYSESQISLPTPPPPPSDSPHHFPLIPTPTPSNATPLARPQIFLTNGASEGVRYLMQSLIRTKALGYTDGVLVPIPQYPMYSALCTLTQGRLVPYYLREEKGWALEVSEQRAKSEEGGLAMCWGARCSISTDNHRWPLTIHHLIHSRTRLDFHPSMATDNPIISSTRTPQKHAAGGLSGGAGGCAAAGRGGAGAGGDQPGQPHGPAALARQHGEHHQGLSVVLLLGRLGEGKRGGGAHARACLVVYPLCLAPIIHPPTPDQLCACRLLCLSLCA